MNNNFNGNNSGYHEKPNFKMTSNLNNQKPYKHQQPNSKNKLNKTGYNQRIYQQSNFNQAHHNPSSFQQYGFNPPPNYDSYQSNQNAKSKDDLKEKRMSYILSQLPNSVLLRNINVKTRTGQSQIDNILITPNGLFIIDTKVHTGQIVGHSDAKNWTQYKVEKETGRQVSLEFYNPLQQVFTHARRLYEFFQEKGFNYTPHCIVYFVNNNVQVNIQGYSQIPIFSQSYHGTNAILNYIVSQRIQYLSAQEMQIVANLLGHL